MIKQRYDLFFFSPLLSRRSLRHGFEPWFPPLQKLSYRTCERSAFESSSVLICLFMRPITCGAPTKRQEKRFARYTLPSISVRLNREYLEALKASQGFFASLGIHYPFKICIANLRLDYNFYFPDQQHRHFHELISHFHDQSSASPLYPGSICSR